MKIKTFKDGNRLVIILEDTENCVKEDMLYADIKAIADKYNADFSVCPDSEAVPVQCEIENGVSDNDVYVETSFFKGNLEDCFLQVTDLKKEIELLSVLGDNAEIYLRYKFSKIDAKAYSEKLSAVQRSKFFEIYKPYMYEELVKESDVQKAIEYYQ